MRRLRGQASWITQGFAAHVKFCLRNNVVSDFEVSNTVTPSSLKCYFVYRRLKGEIYFFVLLVLSLLSDLGQIASGI